MSIIPITVTLLQLGMNWPSLQSLNLTQFIDCKPQNTEHGKSLINIYKINPFRFSS